MYSEEFVIEGRNYTGMLKTDKEELLIAKKKLVVMRYTFTIIFWEIWGSWEGNRMIIQITNISINHTYGNVEDAQVYFIGYEQERTLNVDGNFQ